MKLKEFEINQITGPLPQTWEINSKEDLLNLWPENEYGRPVLGDGLHILIYTSNGAWLPCANIESKEDWNKLHEWIPTLREILEKNKIFLNFNKN